MLKSSSSTRRAGIFVALFSALLLLPALHLHPASEHAHGTEGAHGHLPVVHVDFFPGPTHDHGTHHKGHGIPNEASPQPLSQVSFPTLLPRTLVFSLLVLERALDSLPVEAPVFFSPFSIHTWILTRDHAPPVQTFAFSPISPRSPPHAA